MEKFPAHISRWTCDQIEEWLALNKFDSYTCSLCKQRKIDGQALVAFTQNDLRKQIETEIYEDAKRLNLNPDRPNYDANYDRPNAETTNRFENGTSRSILVKMPSELEEAAGNHWTPNGGGFLNSSLNDENSNHLSSQRSPSSDSYKALASIIYFLFAFLSNTFVLAAVHNRIPDPAVYPPLPDIFLDNISRVPGAFKVAEAFISFQAITLLILFITHKHRLILIRRSFALYGTVFALRSITMYVTSLPVPSRHLECTPKLYDDFWAKFNRAFEIALGMGMSSNGITTCGDYMFSGHAATLTLSSFFITEYSPKRFFLLHIASRIMTYLGMFCILASHEHYTIDVFAAFYLTARLFVCYHTLTNANCAAALAKRDFRTKSCFVIFSYFENNTKGSIPNEYEWPFTWPCWLKSVFG